MIDTEAADFGRELGEQYAGSAEEFNVTSFDRVSLSPLRVHIPIAYATVISNVPSSHRSFLRIPLFCFRFVYHVPSSLRNERQLFGSCISRNFDSGNV